MKPGNLRKQGANSGGSDRKMREENLRAPQSGALFCFPRRERNSYAKENFYFRIRN